MRFKGPIQTPAGQLIAGLNITDGGAHSYPVAAQLTFNPATFYLAPNSASTPIVNSGGFKGVLLKLSGDVSLVSGAAGVTGNWTTFQNGYDYGGWFSAGSPTLVTVPAGVNQIIISGIIVYTPTGVPSAASYNTTTLRNNAATIIPGGFSQRSRCVVSSGIAQWQQFTFPPLNVKSGDQIDLTFQSTWVTASAMTVSAANTTFAVYARPDTM